MSNLLTMGINFAFDASDVLRGSKTVRRSMTDIERHFKNNQKAAKDLNDQFRNVSDQGMANIQAGLVQLSTYLLNANVSLNNFFDKTINRFKEVEQAKAGLEVTLGLTTATGDVLASLEGEMKEYESIISQTALTTKFSQKEVIEAFQALIQSGYKGKDAIQALQSTLDFTAASQGALTLEDGIQATTLAVTSLGSSIDKSNVNLDMLLRTSQRTKLSLQDMVPMLESMSSAEMSFGTKKDLPKSSELLVLASALRMSGKSARESGQGVKAFGRSILNVYNTVNKEVFRGEKAFKRVNEKRIALIKLFLNKRSDLIALSQSTDEEDGKRVNEAVRGFFENNDGQLKSSTELLNAFTTAFRNMVGEGKKATAGDLAILQKAIGGEEGLNMVKAAIKLQDQLVKESGNTLKHEEALADLAQQFADIQNDSRKAAERDLETVAGKTKLLESATDAVSQALARQDAATRGLLDVQIGLSQTTAHILDQNEGLSSGIMAFGRVLQVATNVGHKFGFAMVAAATFSVGLNHAVKQAGVQVKGLGGTLRVFRAVFLTPTFVVMGQVAGALALIGIGMTALINYLGDGATVGESFSNVMKKIRETFNDVLPMMKMLFSSDQKLKEMTGAKSISQAYQEAQDLQRKFNQGQERLNQLRNKEVDLTSKERNELIKLAGTQEYLDKQLSKYKGLISNEQLERLSERNESFTTMASVVDTLRNSFKNVMGFLQGALGPLTQGVGVLLEIITRTLNLMLLPLRALAKGFGFLSDTLPEATNVGSNALGSLAGSIVAVGLVVKGLMVFLTVLANKYMSLKVGVANYARQLNMTNKFEGVMKSKFGGTIGQLDRLRLQYFAATGQLDKYAKKALEIKNQMKDGTYKTFGTTLKNAFTGALNGVNSLKNSYVGLIQKNGLLKGSFKFAFGGLKATLVQAKVGLLSLKSGVTFTKAAFLGLGRAIKGSLGPITLILGAMLELGTVFGFSEQTMKILTTAVTLMGVAFSLSSLGLWAVVAPLAILIGKFVLLAAVIGGAAYLMLKLAGAMGSDWAKDAADSIEKRVSSITSSFSSDKFVGPPDEAFPINGRAQLGPDTVGSAVATPRIGSPETGVQQNNKFNVTVNINGNANAEDVRSGVASGIREGSKRLKVSANALNEATVRG